MSNEFEQPVEPMSRTEDLLRTGTEEPVIAMSRIEKILRGEKIKPQSRIEDLLLKYNPSDILIEKSISENGVYYARIDDADGYYKVIVDTPTYEFEHLVETITTNGLHTFTPTKDGYEDASITVNVQPNTMEKSITANGTYLAANDNVDGYSKAIVNVPLGSKSVTANGSYNASSDNLAGYSSVNVNVQPATMEKSITANGTYLASNDNVYGYSKATVNVPPVPVLVTKQIPNLPASVASFSDGAVAPMMSLKVGIEPQQDLHGYDSPWVGGAGRNLFNMGSKWSGTASDLTFTTDDNYVYINGTKNGGTYITPNQLTFDLTAGTYYVKTIVIGGTASIQPQLTLIGDDISIGDTIGNERTFTLSNTTTVSIRFAFWNDGAIFDNYKLGVVISKTANIDKFYPYSNICPISGWTESNITRCGVNFFNKDNYQFVKGYLDGNGVWQGTTTIYDYPTEGLNYWDSVIIDVEKFGAATISYSGFVSLAGTLRGLVDKDFNRIVITGDSSIADYTIDLSQYPTAKYLVLSFMRDNHDFSNAMLAISSSIPTYEPYNGQTYTIDLDGTRYGGTLDVVNGEGDDDREKLMLADDVSWIKYGSYGYGIRLITSKFDSISNDLLMEKSMSNMLTFSTIWGEGDDRIVFGNGISKTTLLLSTASTGLDANSSIDDVKAWLRTAGAYMIAPLATPTTFHTQPTSIKSLDGENNVWADTGDVLEGEYLHVNTEVGTLINKTITQNGSYCAARDDDADGYLTVDVDVAGGGGGDIYKYHWSNDGKICVREGLGEYVWFFVGYTKETTTDIEPPEELVDYFPAYCGGDDGRSVIYGQAYATASATASATTPDRYIGFYNNKIRTWNSDLSQLISGTFYGIVCITPDTDVSSCPQTNDYTSPTDVPISDITLIEKTITANGTYSAEDDGYVGYSDVTVNVPSGAEKTKVVTDDMVLVSQNGSTVDWHEDGSVDLTWLGGSSIGFNYVGLVPIKDAKRILIHMDELGESYQHKYSTEQRNWNFSVGLTNVALPQNYIDLATLESQGKLVTDVEVDVVDNYGKTDLNYIIDLSSYQNQDLYLFILAPGMTIEGLKVTVIYDNVPTRMRYTGYNRLFKEASMDFQFDPNGKFKTIWTAPGSSIGCTLQGVRDLNGVITSVHVTGSITDSYEYASKTGYDRCQFVVGFTDQRWDSIIYVGYNVNPYIKEEITLTNQQEVNDIDILIDLTDSQYEQYANTSKYFFISLLGISGEFEVTME